ncbi:hypothetical protein HOLleu_23630 [Holothuria leucospilota]|uniref:Secreted protein n=1 Tax=Holothuria leucospilota TaxID=206669 RepID=A0A9Q1BV97_HOLLE|nr:hypothetical protein HOLleu_23630 [Holothuria leucospilota]
MLQFLIVVLLVAESVYSAKAMGIGRFARTFPCSEKYCPLSAKLTGCTKTPILNHTQIDRIPATNQSTSGQSSYEQLSSTQDTLDASITNHEVQFSDAVLQTSLNYTTTGQESDNRATTELPISTTTPSPPRKVFTMNEQGVNLWLDLEKKTRKYGFFKCTDKPIFKARSACTDGCASTAAPQFDGKSVSDLATYPITSQPNVHDSTTGVQLYTTGESEIIRGTTYSCDQYALP